MALRRLKRDGLVSVTTEGRVHLTAEGREIARRLDRDIPGPVLEIGSGIGRLKETIPHCLTSDFFHHDWLDRRENAYALSGEDGSVGHLVLFDVDPDGRLSGLDWIEPARAFLIQVMIYGILLCTVFFLVGLMGLTLWAMNDFPFFTLVDGKRV